MSKIAVVFHSGYGHTQRVAKAVAEGAQRQAGAEVRLLPVGELDDEAWDWLDNADAMVFGSPTYMGGVSADFKKFADASSKAWAAGKWKDKVAGGFTNSASMSGDKLSTLQYMATFAMQHGMIWVGSSLPPAQKPGDVGELNRVGSWLGVMTQSDHAPAEVTPPEADLETARIYGARVAEKAALLRRSAEAVV